jgi:hypothetical protein
LTMSAPESPEDSKSRQSSLAAVRPSRILVPDLHTSKLLMLLTTNNLFRQIRAEATDIMLSIHCLVLDRCSKTRSTTAFPNTSFLANDLFQDPAYSTASDIVSRLEDHREDTMFEDNDKYLSPGYSARIWSSRSQKNVSDCPFASFGWTFLETNCDHGQGNRRVHLSLARAGKLFERDCVWAVTQTMVSPYPHALWALYSLCGHRVYPGFWGRFLNCSLLSAPNWKVRFPKQLLSRLESK